MLQREDGPIPPDFRLWKPLEGDNEGWLVLQFPILNTYISLVANSRYKVSAFSYKSKK